MRTTTKLAVGILVGLSVALIFWHRVASSPSDRSAPSPQIPRIESERYLVELRSRTFTPPADVQAGLDALAKSDLERAHVFLQFFELDEALRKRLAERGIRLLDSPGAHSETWMASVPTSLPRDDAMWKQIRWLGQIEKADKLASLVRDNGIGEWARLPSGEVSLHIVFFDDVSDQAAKSLIQRYGGRIRFERSLTGAYEIHAPPETLEKLLAEDSVQWIDQSEPPPTIEAS